jgi:hypothetical protein
MATQKTIIVHIDETSKTALQIEAKRTRRSLSGLVRTVLDNYLTNINIEKEKATTQANG